MNVCDVTWTTDWICSSALSFVLSPLHILTKTSTENNFLISVFLSLLSQEHPSGRNSQDSNRHSADQSFKLVDETQIILASNTNDRRDDITQPSQNIKTREHVVPKGAAEDSTSLNSQKQTSEMKMKNVISLMHENMIASVEPAENLRTNRALRIDAGGQLTVLPVSGTGNTVYGSDQKIYRMLPGPSGPSGPRGRRVSVSF